MILKNFLKQRQYVLISFKENKKILKDTKYKSKDFIYFIEELSYLINSGISIDKALTDMIKDSNKISQEKFLKNILQFLKEGHQFSVSLKLAAKKNLIDLDNLSILLISTNEVVGNLANGLLKTKEHLEFKEKIKSDISQALSYPIFLIIMSAIMIIFVFLFIVPKFATIFTPEEFENLPVLSKFILTFGVYIDNNIIMITIITLLLSFLLYIFKDVSFRYIKNTFLLIPMFQKLTLSLELSYFFTSLNLMIEGGIDFKNALLQSSRIITYIPLKNLVLTSIDELKKGINISETFSYSNIIPTNTISLIRAGEHSASMDQITLSLSKRFMSEFKNTVKRYLSILEPLVIVFMGFIIAIIVISIMLAVMSITDVIS